MVDITHTVQRLRFTFRILCNPSNSDAAEFRVTEAKKESATWASHQPLLRQLLAHKAVNQPATSSQHTSCTDEPQVNGHAPQYLGDHCIPLSSQRHPHSADTNLLHVPLHWLCKFGCRASSTCLEQPPRTHPQSNTTEATFRLQCC